MISLLKAYHGRKRENLAHGLELLVHFQIGLEFQILSLEVVVPLAPIFHFLAMYEP